MFKTPALAFLTLVFAGGLATAAHAAIDISSGDTGAASWGPGDAAYGQTFTVEAGDSILVDYTFSILSLNDTFPFVSQVYVWNGSAPTGFALFTSNVVTSPTPGGTYTPYTFSPLIAVAPGQQYIALVTNYVNGVSLGGVEPVGGQMLLNGTNPYAGGRFTFSSGVPPTHDPVTSQWSTSTANLDAVFQANFSSAVPEPASLVIWGGIVLVGLAARLPRQKVSQRRHLP